MTMVDTHTGEILEPLTNTERTELATQETVIERGAEQVAAALTTIRDRRLYRETHPTFEAYCRDRWGMSHRHVNRQIVAAEVAEALGPMGPVSERQARELADLRDRPEELRETYQRAERESAGKKVTAAAIRAARKAEPPPVFVAPVPDEPDEPLTGLTEWSQRVQAVSATCPINRLSDKELNDLQGAATYLRDYCLAEQQRREDHGN